MTLKLLLAFLPTLCSCTLLAQATGQPDEHSDHHELHNNEIGVANAPVYFIKEKEFAYGLHVHYVRSIRNSGFGLGLGYERIFDAHGHNTFGIVASYRPVDKLTFGVSPGLTIEDNSSEAHFALHLESSYEFEIQDFHLGPVFEFSYDREDYHVSLGLHVGIGF